MNKLALLILLTTACNAADNPMVIIGKTGVTITGVKITNSKGSCITVKNSKQIKILNSQIGPCKGPGVDVESVTGLTVSGNKIDHAASGFYALSSTLLDVNNNQISNVQGPLPRGQCVQFNQSSGLISDNTCTNPIGSSPAEDAINIFQSSHVKITGNTITGGGPSRSGGGIMLGDNGGSDLVVINNKLTDPGQYGIGVASGTNIRVTSNTVTSQKFDYSNVGVYVWNQYNHPCADITIVGNTIKWINSKGVLTNTWDAGNCKNVIWK